MQCACTPVQFPQHFTITTSILDQSQSRVTISSPDPFVWRVWWVVVVHQDTHENLEHAWVTSTYNIEANPQPIGSGPDTYGKL